MRERLNWLDAMRGLAFLMVIYYHLSTRSAGGIVPYFTPVFLMAFFFVSGYLTKSGMPFGKVLEQRTRTLFVPLLIFGLGGGIIILAKMNLGAVMDGIVEVFKGVFYQYGKHQTLWFIASLYVYSLMFYWVDNFCRTPIRLAIGCVLLIIMGQLLQYVLSCPRLPYKLESSLWAMAIMGIGKLYKLYEREVDAKIMKWKFAAGSLVLYIVLIYSFDANVLYDGHPNWFLAISIPMTGLHWMLYLSKYVIVNMKSLLFIGSNSLVYFAIHRQVLNAVEATTKKIMASLSIEPSLWSNLLEMDVIAIIIVIPVWIINKYIPQVTGKGWKLWNA